MRLQQAYHAHAVFGRLPDGYFHGVFGCNLAEGPMSRDQSAHRRLGKNLRNSIGHNIATLNRRQISTRQVPDAMCVNATEIGRDQMRSDAICIGLTGASSYKYSHDQRL